MSSPGQAKAPLPNAGIDLEKADVAAVYEALTTSAKGLSASEAASRLQHYGRNELADKEVSNLLKFLRFFWGPIAWMIEAAALLSLLMGHWADLTIILVLLFYNAISGFWQERKASDALAALKAGLAPKATALRDGTFATIDAAEVVPGDVLRIKLGEVVPADVRFIDGDYISIDQAALTGESLPVAKKIGDEGYSGSIAKQGEMSAVVIATGDQTFFGRTASLVAIGRQGRLTFAAGHCPYRRFPHHHLGDPLRHPGLLPALPRRRAGDRLAVVGPRRHRADGAGAADRLDPGRDADGDDRHQLAGCARSGEEEGDRLQARGDRGTGRCRYPLLGQDRHADQERADAWRSDPLRRENLRTS